MSGFIVTWDVDSQDASRCSRLRRFVFGHRVRVHGKEYRYEGFVELEGVRYLGQSVVFVIADRLLTLTGFLRANGIEHVVPWASLGPVLAQLGETPATSGHPMRTHRPSFCSIGQKAHWRRCVLPKEVLGLDDSGLDVFTSWAKTGAAGRLGAGIACRTFAQLGETG
ncbi:MAG: hypothetical protein ACT4OI_10725 [Methanobacteriota archaeon]